MSSVCRITGALIVTLLHPSLLLAAEPQRPVHPGDDESWANAASVSVSLSLAEAVERSRQQHPRVAAALMAAQALGHSSEQVGKWANPEVQFYQEQFSAVPDIDQMILSVSQRIRIGGQLGLASDAGKALRDAALAEAWVTQEQLTLVVQQTYAQLYRVQESLSALEAARNTVADLIGDLELRLQEGDVAPFDLARMRIEDESLRAQEGKLRAERRVGWQRLSFLLASSVPAGGWSFAEPVAPIGEPGPRSAQEMGEAGEHTVQSETDGQSASKPGVAVKRRFDIQAAAFRIDAATSRAEAAGRDAIPDLVLSLGYTRLDPGFNGFVWGVNATIPLFDSKSENKAARLAEARSLERQYDALVHEAESEARGAWQEYLELSNSWRELREDIGPRREILPIARTAYEEGEISVTGLLDAARAELAAELRELELGHLVAGAWFRWRYASGQYLGGEEQE